LRLFHENGAVDVIRDRRRFDRSQDARSMRARGGGIGIELRRLRYFIAVAAAAADQVV